MDGSTGGVVLGFALAGALLVAARRRDVGVAGVAAGAAVAVVAVRIATGIGFVPGLLAAAPLATVGLAARHRVRKPDEVALARRMVVAIAVIAVPVVIAFQYTGGAAPQWGGRYLLTTAFLLTTAGVVALANRPRAVQVAAIAAAGLVTAFGLTWLGVRSHDVARTVRALDQRPEPLIVSSVPHLAREGGAFYGDKRWLTAPGPRGRKLAGRVADQAGVTKFVLVQYADDAPVGPDELPGWRAMSVARQPFLPGVPLRVTIYWTEHTFSQ